MVDPEDWPPPRGALAAKVEGGHAANNSLHVVAGSAVVNLWLSPPLIDFQHRASITVNGRRIPAPLPSLETLLEDARTRGDRQHPFWRHLETSSGRVLNGK